MKTFLSILSLTALLFTGCVAPQSASSGAYRDDVYYSSKDAAADKEKEQLRIKEEQIKAERAQLDERSRKLAQQERELQERTRPEKDAPASDDYYKASDKKSEKNGDTYVTNNYYDQPFDYDDYYDYEYAARLRRFHNNVGSYGYYDNYYTNSYWYTYDPFYYGTSVYMGYNFWGPSYAIYSYNPGFYFYSNFGWGCDPWYHPYGYNPYAGYGYMYGYNNGYYNGYNNGYYNGYNNGYSNNYFNSYDNNSYYYGPRGTTASNGRVTAQPTLAHRYMQTVEAETHKPFEATRGRDNNQYIKPTTVNDYMSRPSNNLKPASIDDRNPRPADVQPANNTRPNTNEKPIYIDERPNPAKEPKDQRDNRNIEEPRQRPTYEQRPQNETPRNETPRNERPHYENHRENNQAPAPNPAPRNFNSGRSGGSSSPSPSNGSKRR